MSEQEPTEPYVFQPLPAPFAPRCYGVGGIGRPRELNYTAKIIAVTREEAEVIVVALKDLYARQMAEAEATDA